MNDEEVPVLTLFVHPDDAEAVRLVANLFTLCGKWFPPIVEMPNFPEHGMCWGPVTPTQVARLTEPDPAAPSPEKTDNP